MGEESKTAKLFVDECVATLRSQKRMAERAVAQLEDDALHKPLPGDVNSVAVVMKHIAGNMRSRWTDFLTTDGEKPWRGRDNEFIDENASRAEIMKSWEESWALCIETVGGLSAEDLSRSVTIRGKAETAASAVLRQLSHYGYHVGQIMIISRILAGDRWRVLTIPLGKSDEYNRKTWGK